MDILLKFIIAFINESRNPNADINTMNQAAKVIAENYFKLKANSDFWVTMDNNFLNDPELYSLLLSVIYYVTKDEVCLNKTEGLSVSRNIDLFMADGMQYQVRLNRFRNSLIKQVPYALLRNHNQFFLNRLLQEYDIKLPYIPYQKRNHKRIVIMTDALLSRLHAPTNLVLELCKILSSRLGYEVFLAVYVTNTDGAKAQAYCVFPYQAKFIAEYNGDFLLNLEDSKLSAYQMLLEKNTVDEFKRLLWRIYDWKPLCVWYIGGNSFWHDACCQFITTISMPCTEGYSVSEAGVLISYVKSPGSYTEQAQHYIQQQGQKTIDLTTGWTYEKLPGECHKEDYKIPADSILFAIVGNRLEDELNETFLEFMEQMAKKNNHIYYAVIGQYSVPILSSVLKERMILLGFREDLINVIEMTDIFLNPPRKGGGSAAGRAQAVGKPVISLKGGDVEAVAGEKFCCNTLEEMGELVERYCTDKNFYNKMSKKAIENYKAKSSIDMGEQYSNVLKTVESWLACSKLR